MNFLAGLRSVCAALDDVEKHPKLELSSCELWAEMRKLAFCLEIYEWLSELKLKMVETTGFLFYLIFKINKKSVKIHFIIKFK